MKNKIFKLGLLLLTLAGATSCHQESDVILSYANNDDLAFSEANESFAGKFRVFWKALNTNYALWDYEKQNGLDWDRHYAAYLPEFEALDKQTTVTDMELKELMTEMIAPLHDGHLTLQFKNHKTGNFVRVSPNNIRNTKIEDYNLTENFTPDFKNYKADIAESLDVNSTASDQLKSVLNTEGIGVQWAKNRSNELSLKTSPTESEATELAGLYAFLKEIEKLNVESIAKQQIQQYNSIALRYSYLNIPYLDPIDEVFLENGIHVTYNLFNDGIAYLYISGFDLSPYLSETMFSETFNASNSHTSSIAMKVRVAWLTWYGTVQQLHKQKQLKGVIIDIRNNRGGYVNDFQYVLGSLLEKGGFQNGWARFKRGLGRYDYSALTPFVMPTLEDEHEVIDDVPVVVLANMHSVSMSEITSVSVKLMPNGKLIGSRTYGGLCGLTDISSFSFDYSGHIGVQDKTPVYCYTPLLAFFDMDKKCHESLGVEPDIKIDLDTEKFFSAGIDNQLERALQYIRTGN